MIKKLFNSKKIMALIVLVILLVVAIVVGVTMTRELGEKGKTEASHGMSDGVPEDDEVYEGNGLEIKGETDEIIENVEGSGIENDSVDSVDVSGTWDEIIDSVEAPETEDDTTQSGDSEQGDKGENTDTNDGTSEDETQEENSEEGILVDEKEWGEIS